MSESLKNKLKQEVEKYKGVQKEYHKALEKRQQLDTQLNENMAVKQELDSLKYGDDVYKLIGPTLMKQDLEEAKQNVSKRMEIIRNELKRIDDFIVHLSEKQEENRDTLNRLQEQIAKTQLKD